MAERDPEIARHRTIQDDRRDLGADAEDVSPLVARPDAPLAEDTVVDAERVRENEPAPTPPALLGGAPVPIAMPSDDVPPNKMSAREDRPIND